jgi:hypothetical protein
VWRIAWECLEIHMASLATRTVRLATSRLESLRRKIGVPESWQFTLKRLTVSEMPLAFGSCAWSYLPDRQFTIEYREDLDPEELDWILAHELWEATLGQIGDFTAELIGRLYGQKGAKPNTEAALLLHARDAYLRDELIEQLVRVTLGRPRPHTLTPWYHAAPDLEESA